MEESSSDRQSALFSRIFPVLVLGFAGGFFDSYTYVARGGVFCNAQTSNLLLMILGLASGRPSGIWFPSPFSSWQFFWKI